MYVLTNCRIYTGFEILENHAVVIADGKIKKICKEDDIPANITKQDLNGAILAPGLIDIQLNGCGGVQFNETLDSLSIETLEVMQKTNLRTGCTSYLPTLITSTDAFIRKAVAVMREYLAKHQNQAIGLHIEGPYISKEKKGIHKVEYIRHLDPVMLDFLCDNADVIKVVTLAPENVEPASIKRLSDAGIHVSIGHTNATYEQCRQGFNAGASLATHLFNAMPYITGREPGAVGAIYDAPEVYAGIIADGMHVAWSNIRVSHNIKRDKLILVTDASMPTGTDIAEFTFGGKTIHHSNGKCFGSDGTLAGSALTMIEALKNAVTHVGIALDEALRMATLYPARAIGEAHHLGAIKEGYIANLVIFNSDFSVVNTIVNGEKTKS